MDTLRFLYYSFPVRLMVLHWRNHFALIALWIFLALLTTGVTGRYFGIHYLMLTPEYLGKVDFTSFFLTGAAFGAFVMIWNLTTYLLSSNRFPFLATLNAPFTTFCINNALLPLGYLLLFTGVTVTFQIYSEFAPPGQILWNITGFLSGFVALIALLGGYLYFTNKDLSALLKPGAFFPAPGGRLLISGRRLPTLNEIRIGATRWRTDTYVTERLHIRLVRSVSHYNQKLLREVFHQNHLNAIVVQAAALLLLIGLGACMDYQWVRIPAAATIYIFASIGMAVFGAVTFWFRQWGTVVFLGLLLLVNLITGLGILNYRNRAYGLDYRADKRAEYSYAALEKMCSKTRVARDKAATLEILEAWLRKNRTAGVAKPKLVIVCVSGGGMRSALWTMQALQQTDRATGGKLLRQTALVVGASGGMLGAAYLREAMLHQGEPGIPELQSSLWMEDMGKDLLNAVGFAVISNDLFYPLSGFKSGNFYYRKDRGYLFERQLNENCRGYFNRKLSEYRSFERSAQIPMMVLSPAILNDARRMLISPQGVSYLMKPCAPEGIAAQVEIDGVDFRKLFAAQEADSLQFSTALRMNCTYPYILPDVLMPTRPSIEVMDAGYRDNYGTGLAVRFAHCFKDWIRENTGGVVLVQVRCWEKIGTIVPSDTKGILDNLFNPLNAAAGITDIQDFEQDNALSLLADALEGNRLETVRFSYRPVRKQREASMNLHLSKREKQDLREAFFMPENQAGVRALKEILGNHSVKE